MDALNAVICDPQYHDILAILKGARNGLVYGAKIRFPHALVMTLIFHGDRPWKDRMRFVINATRQHAFNLCKFVMIYKTALLAQRKLGDGKERSVDTFLAGLLGGWIVFGERNAVNEQIVSYCVSRVLTSFLPRAGVPKPAAKPVIDVTPSTPSAPSTPITPKASETSTSVNSHGMPHPPGYPYPAGVPPDNRVFEVFAALTWGAVMWLFRWRRHTLQNGLVNSMQYLYLDSEVWTNLKNLLWHNIA